MSLGYQSNLLGKMTLLESYEYYDEPILFSCLDDKNNIYLSVWCNTTEEFNVWLYVKVSLDRLKQIRIGLIDLKEAFQKADSADFYISVLHKNSVIMKTVNINPNEIIEDWLPDKNQYLDLHSDIETLYKEKSKQ